MIASDDGTRPADGPTSLRTRRQVMGAGSFRGAGEVTTDGRGRLSLAQVGGTPLTRYQVAVDDDGCLLLVPVISIPRVRAVR